MTLHAELARRVVELLGHVFADVLQLAAATRRCAGGPLGLVLDLATRQDRRQRLALGRLLLSWRLGWLLELADLSIQRLQVLVDGLFQQALLLRSKAL